MYVCIYIYIYILRKNIQDFETKRSQKIIIFKVL